MQERQNSDLATHANAEVGTQGRSLIHEGHVEVVPEIVVVGRSGEVVELAMRKRFFAPKIRVRHVGDVSRSEDREVYAKAEARPLVERLADTREISVKSVLTDAVFEDAPDLLASFERVPRA